jgi:hypothetical protein
MLFIDIGPQRQCRTKWYTCSQRFALLVQFHFGQYFDGLRIGGIQAFDPGETVDAFAPHFGSAHLV